MKRKIYAELVDWKSSDSKMPLLLHGARQIGKTYILEEFGKNEYDNYLYLNFEKDENLKSIFQENISPNILIAKIEKYFNDTIIIGKTLLIFDEIQACNRALTSLKYFCEEMNELDVIGAGSLLGVYIKTKDYSFPVGKVFPKMMYPLDFEEFLMASNMNIFKDDIKSAFDTNKPLSKELHENLLNLYKTYLIIGGMPAVVEAYFNGQGVDILSLQESIINTYISDMGKYSPPSQVVKTISTYNSLLAQLAKDNKKFQYKLISKGARASLFGDSIDWLVNAGVALKCDKVVAGDAPLEMVKDLASFKLYISDVGLFCNKAGIRLSNFDIFDGTYLGGLIENYVAQSLKSNNLNLYYWESSHTAEVDFIIIQNGNNIPVEVKKKKNVKSRSLNIYIEKYKPKYAIRVSEKQFGLANGIKSVPLYAVYLIKNEL